MQTTLTKCAITLAATLLITACAGTSQTTTLADGSTAMRIDCDSSSTGLNYCFERAGKTCGAAGYTIVDPNGVRMSGSNVGDPAMSALVKAYATDRNSIYVKCGD